MLRIWLKAYAAVWVKGYPRKHSMEQLGVVVLGSAFWLVAALSLHDWFMGVEPGLRMFQAVLGFTIGAIPITIGIGGHVHRVWDERRYIIYRQVSNHRSMLHYTDLDNLSWSKLVEFWGEDVLKNTWHLQRIGKDGACRIVEKS